MLHCSACTTPRCQCNVMILSEFGQPPSPFVRYSNGTISPAPVWADSRTVATLNEALRFVSSVTTHSCMAWLNVQRIKIIECHKSRHFLPSVFGRIRTVDERTKLNWIEMEMLCCDNWMSFCAHSRVPSVVQYGPRARARKTARYVWQLCLQCRRKKPIEPFVLVILEDFFVGIDVCSCANALFHVACDSKWQLALNWEAIARRLACNNSAMCLVIYGMRLDDAFHFDFSAKLLHAAEKWSAQLNCGSRKNQFYVTFAFSRTNVAFIDAAGPPASHFFL